MIATFTDHQHWIADAMRLKLVINHDSVSTAYGLNGFQQAEFNHLHRRGITCTRPEEYARYKRNSSLFAANRETERRVA